MPTSLGAPSCEVAPKARTGVAGVVACAGALAGLAVQMHQARLLPASMSWVLLLTALVAGTVAAWTGSRPPGGDRTVAWAVRAGWPWLVLVVAAAVAAFASVSLRASARLAERLPAALEGRDLVVTGLVAELPRTDWQGSRFLFEVESATLEGAPVTVPGLVSLAWYRLAEPDALLLGPDTEVRAGQRWRFTVRLRRPHGLLNPGGFDLELWLFERGIGATGLVRSRAGDVATRLAERAGAPVERARQSVRDAIERRLAPAADAGDSEREARRRIAGVIAALAVGDQGAIERDDWALFRDTGVAHLMSISGLHVTMLAWLAGMVIGRAWRLSGRAMLRWPAPLAARWGGVAVALGYSVFAGWGVPAQRTVVMLATLAVLQSLALRWPLPALLLAAATVVLAIDPWAMTQPGFWLSFVAVALLAASQPARALETSEAAGATSLSWPARAAGLVREALRTQAIATVGLAPITLVFFQQLSVVGFGANLVAIPLVTLVVTPLALAGVLVPPLWDVAAAVLAALMAVLRAMVQLAPGAAVWQAAAAPTWAMAAGLLGGLVAVLPLPWRLRVLSLPLMLPLLAPPLARPAEGQVEVVAIDIGQGTAVLVRTRHHLLLYDTGPAFTPEADAGSRHVVPLLRRRGERAIDMLMLSHRDTDHVGGAAAVLGALPVRTLASSLDDTHPLLATARERGAALQRCERGQRWVWDGVSFEVLHPLATDYPQGAQKANAMSCVLRIDDGRTRVLLTGDIEAPQEAALLGRERGADGAQGDDARASLRADLLLVPHHGSRTSSTPAFIDAVAPARAVVQAAYLSRFGHPAPDVEQRYVARGIEVLRSDRCGALAWQPPAPPVCEREAARRYWHWTQALPAP